jgi:malic enzyme
MLQEGMDPEDAVSRFWIVDKDGLLGMGRNKDNLSPSGAFFTRSSETNLPRGALADGRLKNNASLYDVVRVARPTILLGLTGVSGTFTEPIIREMSKHVQKPIVFPLSNPTSHAECTAKEAYEWSSGRAVVASGSPFEPVMYEGTLLTPSQTNNM